jgi:hypothetical protein
MKKLISMKDYVITQWSIDLTKIQRENIKNYAHFLNQPLKKGMFVPCDEDDEVLEEPNKENYTDSTGFVNNAYFIETNDYQKAKEKVIFEGFEISKWNEILKKDIGIIEFNYKEKSSFFDCLRTGNTNQIKTIEDLIPYNLELTENINL